MVDGIYHSVQSRPKSKSKSSRLLFHLVSSSCSLLASMFRASSNSEGSEEQPSSSSWNPVSILAGGGSSSPSSASSMATWFSVEMCGAGMVTGRGAGAGVRAGRVWQRTVSISSSA